MLKNRYSNGRSLFVLVTVPIIPSVAAATPRADLPRAEDISPLLQLTLRCPVPWLYLAFAASSLPLLAPGAFSPWAMRNRRIFGLSDPGTHPWRLEQDTDVCTPGGSRGTSPSQAAGGVAALRSPTPR